MDQTTRDYFEDLHGSDAEKRYTAFQYIIDITNYPVDWAYEVWDELLDLIRKGDNHQRAIGVQVLSNLAKSDAKKRMAEDLDQVIAITKDEKFVTARHALQSLWKIASVSEDLKKKIVNYLKTRFDTSIDEKNCTLVRYDILDVIRKIYNNNHDKKLLITALALIKKEDDDKYRKKYNSVWKDVAKEADATK